jgi:Pyridoxamine 5'-phosphate oxidase
MGKQYSEITDELKAFIETQKLFFVGTAAAGGRINVSPKGMDSLRVLDRNRVVWLNLTGSGNETAAHVRECNRMTLMFCAFEGSPLILRLYGNARAIHRYDADWDTCHALFNPLPGARQIFDMQIDLVQTSCGMGVPLFDYAGDRKQLIDWAVRKGDAGLKKYREEKNRTSLDGKPTHIMGNSD